MLQLVKTKIVYLTRDWSRDLATKDLTLDQFHHSYKDGQHHHMAAIQNVFCSSIIKLYQPKL